MREEDTQARRLGDGRVSLGRVWIVCGPCLKGLTGSRREAAKSAEDTHPCRAGSPHSVSLQ